MKLLGITVMMAVVFGFAAFSPFRSTPDATADGVLLSPEDLQRHINAVLTRYGREPIAVDGRLGTETNRAYIEAYSFEQVEKEQRGYYE